MKALLTNLFLFLLLLGLAGCGRSKPEQADTTNGELIPVTLQTDWFAQAEHGGFYQALAKGYYREAGLDVTLLQGGPNSMSLNKVLTGKAQFAMNKADAVIDFGAQGLDVQPVMAHFQHDPQALMLHADDPAQSISDLDGRSVMAIPGHTWIKYVEAQYGIDLKIVPHTFSLERFLSDPQFIQQCMVTNEPFYVRQAGQQVKTFPTATSGFDPYHVVYGQAEWIREHPDVVERFVAASVRGWKDYLENDPSPAFDLIQQRNQQMSRALLAYGHDRIVRELLTSGHADQGEAVGQLDPRRLQQLADQLRKLGIIPKGEGIPGFDPELVPASARQ
ncbi:MAG: NitT/TauT family transport system substrate-binding protein [Puniceicoccaceae bacterium 5H]|nr:MAG: NitT/TauT family transport system substrate-binding protein [Puniceicoccaceae bacterium 5H]